MDIGLVQGQAKTEFELLDSDWIESTFANLNDATTFALAHGWTAKPQRLQLRKISDDQFIVERFDPNGCGCGG